MPFEAASGPCDVLGEGHLFVGDARDAEAHANAFDVVVNCTKDLLQEKNGKLGS